MQRRRVSRVAAGLVFAAVHVAGLMAAQAQGAATTEPFQWSKLTITVGSTPSGGFDTYGRLLSRHIGKHLSGHPNVIVQNKPGAGGMLAYNHIYNTAPKDGTEIALSAPGNLIDKLLTGDKTNARYEPEKFGWIGVMGRDTAVFVVSRTKGITLKGILDGRSVVLGMVGAGGNSGVYGRALKELLGLNIRLVAGYAGMPQLLLAFENGEVDGVPASNWDTLKATREQWFTSGAVDVILQYGAKRHPDLPNVPLVHEILTKQEDREAMKVFTTLEMISRPVFTTPDLPPERLRALRRAFEAVMRDPELIEEAKKLSLGIDWVPGDEVADLVNQITHPSPAAAKKIRELASH
jgi:tripartite-type tricarboxylate transporter receptor subunit TctC